MFELLMLTQLYWLSTKCMSPKVYYTSRKQLFPTERPFAHIDRNLRQETLQVAFKMTVVKIAFMFLVLLSCSVLTEQIRSKLVKRQPKPGSCPAKPSPVGPCIEGCKKDLECPNTEKCCFTGCGHVCMKPDRAALIAPGGKREFEASCPKPQGPGLCAELCDTERGCRTDELCCFNGCGHSCMKPVR